MSMPNFPLVSLCMATCSRPDLLHESLSGLLRQRYSPLEIVVLVDGGCRGSITLLESIHDPRLRWFATPKPSGMARAWNRVCTEANGKYFLFCADDDVLLDNAIDEQVQLLETYHEVGFCHADFGFIGDDGAELGRWVSHRGRFVDDGLKAWAEYLVATGCCMQSAVVRKDLWDAVGGWDNDAGNPADNSLYLKLLRHAAVGHVPKVACHYRLRTRTPDSWEKRFRDVREYYALAERHLMDPPPGLPVPVRQLQRRLSNALVLRLVALIRSATRDEQAEEAREFMLKTVAGNSVLGSLCSSRSRLVLLALTTANESFRLSKTYAKAIVWAVRRFQLAWDLR